MDFKNIIIPPFHTDETSAQGNVVKKPAVVQVRVMVTESTNANGIRLLSVQEQIVEVADDEVDQIDVKEIVLEFGSGIQEKRRSITVIKLAHSKIHKQPRKADKHVWARKGLDLPFLRSDGLWKTRKRISFKGSSLSTKDHIKRFLYMMSSTRTKTISCAYLYLLTIIFHENSVAHLWQIIYSLGECSFVSSRIYVNYWMGADETEYKFGSLDALSDF